MGTDKEPLLTTMGYQKLLEMISPEEIQQAQVLLKSFLTNLSPIGIEKIAILAYLMGIQQGYHELYSDSAAKNLAERLLEVNRMGKVYGFLNAVLLFGQGYQFMSAIFPNQKNAPPTEGKPI